MVVAAAGSRVSRTLFALPIPPGQSCPPSSLLVEEIPNGIPIDQLAGRKGFVAPGLRYALAVGRICPEKGFHLLALDAAEKAGVPLYLAGKLFPYPDGHTHRACWLPSLVAETSSLVAMESIACGTPVVAFPAGALPEVIEDGRTGLPVRDSTAMAEAISAVRRFDRAACRRIARERFSAPTMVERYLDLYRRLIGC